MARVAGSKREPKPVDDVRLLTETYVYEKAQHAAHEKETKRVRDLLMTTLEHAGFTDADGHQWIEFDPPVGDVVAIQRQRRVGRGYDEEAAEQILTAAGLAETCFKMVRVIDDEAVEAAVYDGTITPADLDTIYPQQITWALQVKK